MSTLRLCCDTRLEQVVGGEFRKEYSVSPEIGGQFCSSEKEIAEIIANNLYAQHREGEYSFEGVKLYFTLDSSEERFEKGFPKDLPGIYATREKVFAVNAIDEPFLERIVKATAQLLEEKRKNEN